MTTIRLTALAALLLAPRLAFSQEMAQDYIGPAPTLSVEQGLCTQALELSCREPRKAPVEEAPKDGFLVKFSRLAGMFMGRVDAGRSGDFHFRFTLDLKTPPSSTDHHINLDNRAG